MTTISPEATAAKALRDWLLWKLPVSCVAVNLTRAATLRAPQPGPYVIPALAVLKVSVTDKAGTTSSAAITAGSRTTAQLVTEINATVPLLASADSDDHLLLTSTNAPSYDVTTLAATNSVMAVGADATLTNMALGWDISGEHTITTPIVPPGPRGVADGFPVGGFFDPSQLGKGRMLVTIGERTGAMTDGNPRRFEWDVGLELAIFRAEPQQVVNQTREGIQAALRCLREVLVTDEGMRFGAPASGVMYGRLVSTRIAPWSFQQQRVDAKTPGGLFFDSVSGTVTCRVFQQT